MTDPEDTSPEDTSPEETEEFHLIDFRRILRAMLLAFGILLVISAVIVAGAYLIAHR